MSKEGNDIIKMNPTTSEIKEQISDMSAEEFRRSFYSWFEENGLVSELRKNLRTQMINTLKNCNLGFTVKETNFTGPLKSQILNVLIAEYLVNMNYLFSLSVYSTEVPFINIFPECKSWLKETPSSNNKQRYFTEKKLSELLELLGFSLESEICKRIIDKYLNSEERIALIPCIVNLISELSKVKWNIKAAEDPNVSALNYEFLMKLEPWLKEIYTLLSNFQIPANILYDVLTHLRKIFLREQEKIKMEETTNFSILQAKIQKDLQKKEFEIAALVADLEQSYFEQKQQMLEDFAREQTEVGKTIEMALKREVECSKMKLSLAEKENNIRIREKEVADELEKLRTQTKLLQDAYDAVLAENIKLSSMKEHNNSDMLYDNESREMLRLEYENLRKEIHATKEALQKFGKSIIKIPKKEKRTVGLLMTKSAAERIKTENDFLVEENKKLKQKVEELNNANMDLTRELDIALRTANMLANERKSYLSSEPKYKALSRQKKSEESNNFTQVNRENSHHTVQEMEDNKEQIKTPVNQVSVPSRINVQSTSSDKPAEVTETPVTVPRQSRSAGENSQNQPRQESHVQHFSEYRKTVPSRLIVHDESESSSSRTLTDEILQEARTRLRSLERATAEVETNYRAFRQRQIYAGLGQYPQDLTTQIRENMLRHHIAEQSRINEVITGLRKKTIPTTETKPTIANVKVDCFQSCVTTNNDVPLGKFNIDDYYTTVVANYPANDFRETREFCIGGNESDVLHMCPSGGLGVGDAKVHPVHSSTDYRSSSANSAESSEFDVPVRNLSISSIDISSDFLEHKKE